MGSSSQPTKPYWLDIVLCESIQYTTPKAEQGIHELNSGSRNFMSLGPIPSRECVETISDLKKYIQRKFKITSLMSLYGSNGKCLRNSLSVHALRQHYPLLVRPADSEKHISTPKRSLVQVPLLNCSLSPLSTRMNASKNATVASKVSLNEHVSSTQEVSLSDSDTDADVISCSNDSSDTDKTVVSAVSKIAARKKLNFSAKQMTYSKWRLHEIQRSIKQFMNDGDSEDKGSLKKWIFEFFGDVMSRGQSNSSNSKIIIKKHSFNEHEDDRASQSVQDMSAVVNLFETVAIVNPSDVSEDKDRVPLNLDVESSSCEQGEPRSTKLSNAHSSNTGFLGKSSRVEFRSEVMDGAPLDLGVEDSTSTDEENKGSGSDREEARFYEDNNTSTSLSDISDTSADTPQYDVQVSNSGFLRRSERVASGRSNILNVASEIAKRARKQRQALSTSKTKASTTKAKILHSCSYPSCNFKAQGLYQLRKHLGVVHFETPFKCDKCSRKYKAKSSYYKHLKTHREKKHVCPFQNCSYKSVYSSSIKAHMMMHSGEKPFACKHCQFKTSWNSNLKQHMRIHTGEKPFACKQCKFKTSENCNLKEHMMIHTGIKPFACTQCKYRCFRERVLRSHVNKRHGVKN